ncbi:competence protein CoiA [Lactococcus nasutitermitis]|uniref:Competence protein CoiA n=1 Tax=Lactococcus nasutitermitis TaxID=1652957 RepID=A0ABV9JC05_9LACT|nr:competence protein CoiA family protein [Lactococcus nasutitermitis]
MLIVHDENKNLINLLEIEISQLKGKFFCPACHSEVRLKNGNIKIPHFSHISLKECHSWSENESAQHLGLKLALYKWFARTEKVKIEHYLPELEQTPDLLVNEKIAIEVQCSHLSIKRLWERTENYRKHGYQVIWLMGHDLWIKKSLTQLQKNLMYFSKNRGFYFWECDLAQEKIRLKSLLHENLRGHVIFHLEEFNFFQGNLLEILRLPFLSQKLLSIPVTRDKNLSHYIRQQLFHRNPKWLKLQEKYYQNGQNLLSVSFERPTYAPVGLHLLENIFDSSVKKNFCQISQDLTNYYQNYWENWQKKSAQKVYPPAFYDKIINRLK